MTLEGREFTEEEYAVGAAEYDRTRREHTTRSTYQRIWVSDSTPSDKDLIIAGPSAGIDRVKRLTLTVLITKGTGRGWLGFQRISEATQVATGAATAAMFSDAEILRPIPYLANPDHAIYLTMYLAAINLVDDGNLRIRIFKANSSNSAVSYAGRYVIERSV